MELPPAPSRLRSIKQMKMFFGKNNYLLVHHWKKNIASELSMLEITRQFSLNLVHKEQISVSTLFLIGVVVMWDSSSKESLRYQLPRILPIFAACPWLHVIPTLLSTL